MEKNRRARWNTTSSLQTYKVLVVYIVVISRLMEREMMTGHLGVGTLGVGSPVGGVEWGVSLRFFPYG